MSEKLTAKQAAEQLLYKPEYAADKSADVKEKAAAFAEGYKAFLNAGSKPLSVRMKASTRSGSRP